MMISIGTMARLAQNPVFGVVLTLFAYEIGQWVHRLSGGWPLANKSRADCNRADSRRGIPYDTYMKGGGLIQFILGPATVALALPIYANAMRIRSAAAGIAAGVAVGATVRLRKCCRHCLVARRP